MIHHLPCPKPVTVTAAECTAHIHQGDGNPDEEVVCKRGDEFLLISIAGSDLSLVKDPSERILLIRSEFIEDVDRPEAEVKMTAA